MVKTAPNKDLIYYEVSMCLENCPCGLKWNCIKYRGITISNKDWKYNHNDKHIAIINEWYQNHFRLKYDCPEIFPNG